MQKCGRSHVSVMRSHRVLYWRQEMEANKIAMGFRAASEVTGMSRRYLEVAARHPNPERRLRTVRVATRRLIRPADLEDWFRRVAQDEAA